MNISQVHLVFQRHAEAISNVWDPAVVGVPTHQELQRLAEAITDPSHPSIKVESGDYKPDGLTGFGIACSETFVANLGGTDEEGRKPRLDNVYMLASSPLTRAFQTLQITQKALDLVGPLHYSSTGPGSPQSGPHIYLHPGLQEATCWPQDFPPAIKTVGSRKKASYIQLTGTKNTFREALEVNGQQEVDFSTAVWPKHVPGDMETIEGRLAAVLAPLDIAAVEKACHGARVWLRESAKKVLELHQKEGRTGTPKIFIALHGGIINFLTQKFYCKFGRASEDIEWSWEGSAALRNLEVNVYAFESLDDDNASLREVDKDDQYTRTLGRYYRHMASDSSLAYRNLDGTLVDQKRAHCDFLRGTADEVAGVAVTQRPLLEALTSWTGAEDFLARQVPLSHL